MGEATQKSLARWGYDLIVSVLIVPGILAALQVNPWVWVIGGFCSLVILRAWEKGYITLATWTPQGKFQNARFRRIAGFVLLLLIVGGGYFTSRWRPTSHKSVSSEGSIVVQPTETLASKHNHMIFLCNKAKGDNERDNWKQYASVVGAAEGVSIAFTDLENGGLKMETTTPQSSGVMKITTEIRRLKDQLFVTRTLETSTAQAWMALPITNPNDPQVQEWIVRTERLVGAQAGICHFF
jgi:hypothetical protein